MISRIMLLISMVFSLSAFTLAYAADFILESPDLRRGAPISASQYWNNFGCTGQNERPVLRWENAPDSTKSFAITFYDKDAPTGSGFWHWVLYNIPANITEIDSKTLPVGAVEGNTDLAKPGFFGPCPPIGRKHTYTYTIHALDVEKLDVQRGATAALTGFFINQHSLDQATFVVTAGPRTK